MLIICFGWTLRLSIEDLMPSANFQPVDPSRDTGCPTDIISINESESG